MRAQFVLPQAIAITNAEGGQIRPELSPYQDVEQARQYCPGMQMVEGTGSEADPFRLKPGVIGNTISPYGAVYRLWEILRVNLGRHIWIDWNGQPVQFKITGFGVQALPSELGTAFAKLLEE